VTYHERPSVVPGVVVWQRGARPGPSLARILPDGCMDLIWDGDRLFVAGPDTRGLGPGLLGVPAHELRDATPPLRDLWPDADARVLHEQVAGQPAAALEQWLERRAESWERPSLGPAVFDLAAGGLPVVAMAERLGYGPRQLHRRCLPLFGYGPQHLARVLRLSRALAAARAGEPLGRVAATAGFADQAHLTREVRDLAGTTPVRLLSESAG
jgi:AraC-like DNA-binding protein